MLNFYYRKVHRYIYELWTKNHAPKILFQHRHIIQVLS
jgi:hypothetical protein